MDGKTELRYSIIAFAIYSVLYLTLRISSSFQNRDSNKFFEAADKGKLEIENLNNIQTKLYDSLKNAESFKKMDSVKSWIDIHIDSIFPGLEDSTELYSYKNIEAYNLEKKERSLQYSHDSLSYKMQYLDSHLDVFGLSSYKSIELHIDSLVQSLEIDAQQQIEQSSTNILIGDYILKLIYLPLILLFPGRWLITYLRTLKK